MTTAHRATDVTVVDRLLDGLGTEGRRRHKALVVAVLLAFWLCLVVAGAAALLG